MIGSMFNHYLLFEAVVEVVPERRCIGAGSRNLTYRDVAAGAAAFSDFLLRHGIGIRRARSTLQGFESGQDHVGLCLHNSAEYIEAKLGAARARAAAFNVNHRYVSSELADLLNDAEAAVLVYHATFAPAIGSALPRLAHEPILMQVADRSTNGLLPNAVDYKEAVRGGTSDVATDPDCDDLYILYTGGTTGQPKGTLWTQAAVYDAALALSAFPDKPHPTTLDQAQAAVLERPIRTVLPLPPLIHGAAEWVALATMLGGGTVVFADDPARFDPADAWRIVERERVTDMLIVGDAFARPLCDELERNTYDTSSLCRLVSGGAALTAALKDRLLKLLPALRIIDAGGSSESGRALHRVSQRGDRGEPGVFRPFSTTCVVSENKTSVLSPGHAGIGWLATSGATPLGYLGDEARTAATFPTIDGRRMTLTGDRARHRADGQIEFLGRESTTINTGGEKVFAEEVEGVLASHPAIDDSIVVGRPSDRWGEEVVALVQVAVGADVTDDELRTFAGKVLAAYKLPKAIHRVETIRRTAAGKADHRWAHAQLESRRTAS